MPHQILADLVLLLHWGYVGYVIVGQLLIMLGAALRWKWIRNIWFRATHLIAILIVVFEALLGITCPLTVWEAELRDRAGQSATEGTFIGHWLHELLFVDLSPRTLSLLYILFAALVVAMLIIAPPRLRRHDPGTSI